MRQAITKFAASVTSEGLTQSRFPSYVPQLIAGFPLYWILQVCDHHLFFGDTPYAHSFLPRIDGVFSFFDSHVDNLGLVSGLPYDVWQFVDWVTTWGATDEHPDKGVPTSGRKPNLHTYFSMLYAYFLKQAARLLRMSVDLVMQMNMSRGRLLWWQRFGSTAIMDASSQTQPPTLLTTWHTLSTARSSLLYQAPHSLMIMLGS